MASLPGNQCPAENSPVAEPSSSPKPGGRCLVWEKQKSWAPPCCTMGPALDQHQISQSPGGASPSQLCSPSMSWAAAPLRGRRLLACLFFFVFFCLAERSASPPRAPGSWAVGCALWKSGCCNRSTCALTLRDRNQLWGRASLGSSCSGRWIPVALCGALCSGTGAMSKCSPCSVPVLWCRGAWGWHRSVPALAVLVQLAGWTWTWLVVTGCG